VRLPWLAHDEAPGPYITIPQYRFNKTKQHTLEGTGVASDVVKVQGEDPGTPGPLI